MNLHQSEERKKNEVMKLNEKEPLARIVFTNKTCDTHKAEKPKLINKTISPKSIISTTNPQIQETKTTTCSHVEVGKEGEAAVPICPNNNP